MNSKGSIKVEYEERSKDIKKVEVVKTDMIVDEKVKVQFCDVNGQAIFMMDFNSRISLEMLKSLADSVTKLQKNDGEEGVTSSQDTNQPGMGNVSSGQIAHNQPQIETYEFQRGILTDEETDYLVKRVKFYTSPILTRRNAERMSATNILFRIWSVVDDNEPAANVIGILFDLMLKYLVTSAGGVYGTSEIAVGLHHPELIEDLFLDSRTTPNLDGFIVQDELAELIPRRAIVRPEDEFKLEIHVFNEI